MHKSSSSLIGFKSAKGKTLPANKFGAWRKNIEIKVNKNQIIIGNGYFDPVLPFNQPALIKPFGRYFNCHPTFKNSNGSSPNESQSVNGSKGIKRKL